MTIAYDQLPLERPQQGYSTRARHPYETPSSVTRGLVTGAAELLTRADPGTRARMLRQFQGTVGNAAVQRMLARVAAIATVPVQRCGPISCDCPPEEKRAVEKQMAIQREVEEGPRDAGAPGGAPGGGTQQASPASAAGSSANPCVTECEERFQECLHPPWWKFWETPDPNQCLAERQACLRECPHSADCGDYCEPGEDCKACCDFDCKGDADGARRCKSKCGGYR